MKPGERISQQLQRWRTDLINLNRANRLLYFHSTRSNLEILEPDPLELIRRLTEATATGLPFHEPPESPSENDREIDAEKERPAALRRKPDQKRPPEILTSTAERPQLL